MGFEFLGTGLRFLFLFWIACLPGCLQVDLSEAVTNNLCNDDFNRADSDRVGGNWNVLGNYAQTTAAQIGIANGKARLDIPATGKGTGIICNNKINKPNSKISVQAIASPVGTGPKLLLFAREQDLLNAYACGFEYNKTHLLRSNGGLNSPVVANTTTITTLTPNTPLELIFETYGSSLICTVKHAGNTVQLTMTDDTFAAGGVGLYSDSMGNALTFFIDDFKTEIIE